MGNQPSSDPYDSSSPTPRHSEGRPPHQWKDDKDKYRSFPGSAILEKTFCGSIDTTDPSEYEDVNLANRLLKKADIMCISSPDDEHKEDPAFFEQGDSAPRNRASALLARALVSEVTDNPKTMKQSEMAAREKQLLKAQEAARKRVQLAADGTMQVVDESRPVGAPGGVGAPNVLSSLAFAVTGDETAGNVCVHPKDAVGGSGGLGYEHGGGDDEDDDFVEPLGPHAITIGLSLSRRHSGVGHPDTVTRQTAFDFNELQDRNYKYVSSTDPSGWRAGGGERGGGSSSGAAEADAAAAFEEGISTHVQQPNNDASSTPKAAAPDHNNKIAAPDVVHIPIIHINCESDAQVDQIVHSLASGEIFIPHMAILPQALSVNGISPPDLVVRFDCERHDELPADEWPNWCLEFMHNQLYEYFYSVGARWMKRPFSITLARKVKWKTVKHMNRYFAHAEQVMEQWREAGPQVLDPQLSYIEGGATPEEVAHPHGIYLFRHDGGSGTLAATNYFAPNFDPPYTTRMTRSLLENVLNKSWNVKRQEWSSQPIPKLVTPNLLLAMACGCTDPSAEGFMAREVTAPRSTPRHGKSVQDALVATSGSSQLLEAAKQQADEYDAHYAAASSSPQQQQQPQSPASNDSRRQRHRQGSPGRSPAAESERSSRAGETTDDDDYDDEEEADGTDEEEPEDDEQEESDYAESPRAAQNEKDRSSSPPPQMEPATDETSASVSSNDEEKKMDDISEKSSKSASNNRGGKPKHGRPKKFWRSTSNATADVSVAMSGTTVMHDNKNKEGSSSKQQQRRTKDTAEDWSKQEAAPQEAEKAQAPQEKSQPQGAGPKAARWAKKKKESKLAREMLDQERKRQELLLQKVQSGESSGSSKKGNNSKYTMTPVLSSSPGNNSPSIGKRLSSGDLEPSESGASMEYSQDGSSAFFTDGGESTVMGQQFLGDASVASSHKHQSSSKHSKSSNLMTPRSSQTEDEEEDGEDDGEESRSARMSVQASSSTVSIVPTDEELLAIGWAKALDATSGNYYYYTLDRKKIVWESPLGASSGSLQGDNSSGMDP